MSGIMHAEQAGIFIPSFIHRKAIEKLFSYSLMENNPAYAQKEAQIRLNEENLAKIMKTRAEDLGPYQQIQLISDTFYLDFADGFLTTMTTAFTASWLFYGAFELAWRALCRAKGTDSIVSIVQIPPLHNDFAAKSGLSQGSQGISLPLLVSSAREELFDSMYPFFNKMKTTFQKEFRPVHTTYSIDQKHRDDIKNVCRVMADFNKNEEILKHTKIVQKVVYSERPKKLTQAMKWGPRIIKFLPLFALVCKYILHQRDINRGKIPKNLLENLLKNLPSQLVNKCREEDSYRFLLEQLINPLWKKHGGNEHRICAELAKMGLKISALEDSVLAADLSEAGNRVGLSKFTMGIHGEGLPSLMPTRIEMLRKAYGHHMLKRMLVSSVLASGFVGIHSLYSLFKDPYFPHEAKTYVIAPFSFWLFISTVYSCLNSFKNRDNSQARADYQVFLKRLSLVNSPHEESFYWSWFLPMWRINKGDIFKLEALFEKRVLEVEASYRVLQSS